MPEPKAKALDHFRFPLTRARFAPVFLGGGSAQNSTASLNSLSARPVSAGDHVDVAVHRRPRIIMGRAPRAQAHRPGAPRRRAPQAALGRRGDQVAVQHEADAAEHLYSRIVLPQVLSHAFGKLLVTHTRERLRFNNAAS